MKFITVTELNKRATHIVSEIESTGEEVIITKKGKPLILMSLVSNSDFGLKETEGVKKHGKRNLQKR
jgi:prevent-host-death family protein